MGRADELRRLDDRVTDVVDGFGGALLVMGEPGAGVTTVLDAVARRAAPRARVVRARAYSGSPGGAVLHDLAHTAGAETASVEAVVDALRTATDTTPLVLILDDGDRADPDAISEIVEVVARTPGTLALLGWQVRTSPPPAGLTGWDRLVVGPLDREASLAVARAAVGREARALPDLVEHLRGNARALRDVPPRLSAEVLDGRAPLPRELPVSDALIALWSRDLPDAGSELDVALLQVCLCLPAPPAAGTRVLSSGIVRLLEGSPLVQVLQPAGTVRWANPWIRDVLVARAAPDALARAHRALATSAVDLGAAPSVVSHHLGRSASGADDAVADALEEQARRAEVLGLPDVVSTAWATAALRTGDPRRRVERAVAGARWLTATGPGMDAIEALLALLEDAELAPDQVAVRNRLRALKQAALDPGARVAAMRASADHARESAPALLPDLLWELSVLACQHGDVGVGLEAAQEYRALEAAGAPGCGPPWTGTALESAALFQSGQVGVAEELRREAHEAAASVDPAYADLDLLFTAVALDDLLLDVSPQAGERLLHLVQRLAGEAHPVACLYGIQGWRARARGDLATAGRMVRLGLDVAVPSSAVDVMCGLEALSAELSAISGDDELDRGAARMRTLMEGTGDLRRLTTLDRALGLRALVAGRLDEAVVHLSAAADVPMLGRGLRDGVLMARVDLVETLVRADEQDSACARAASVLDVLDQMDDALARALAARVRAIVECDDDVAVRLFADSLAHHGDALDLFEHARTYLLRGERLRRSRHRGAARRDLLEASRRFEHLGATPWQARAQSELRASGGAVGAPLPATNGVGLTAQELAVATAVARGASNREVAEMLFLSPRTVEYHLGNAYRKLGVHGRGALAVRLLDAPATRTPDGHPSSARHDPQ